MNQSMYTTSQQYENKKTKAALTTKGNEADNYLTMTTNAIKQEQQKHKYESLEFKEYYERRRMLEKLISRIYSKDATAPKTDTVDLITKL